MARKPVAFIVSIEPRGTKTWQLERNFTSYVDARAEAEAQFRTGDVLPLRLCSTARFAMCLMGAGPPNTFGRTSMLDDMQGLFANASDAYVAGKRQGRDDMFNYALRRLGELSSEYEKAGNVDAFRAAEMACGTLRSAKIIIDRNAAGETVQ